MCNASALSVLLTGLCKVRKSTGRKRSAGRPCLSIETQLKVKRQREQVQSLPTTDVRSDEHGHWPELTARRMHCRVPLCKSQSQFRCIKCNVYLCLTKSKNCFTDYHTK